MSLETKIKALEAPILLIATIVGGVVLVAVLFFGCTTVTSTEFQREQEEIRQEEIRRQASRCRELREDLGLEWLQESCDVSRSTGVTHSYACDTVDEYASRCASFHQD